MADADKTKPPESPTTARELDFDDEEDIPTSSPKPVKTTAGSEAATAPATAAGTAADAAAPPHPPRPLSPREQAESTLREAFPSIDAAVVKAVLAASGGQVEPAFNALLGMSDPDAQQHEPTPPAPPPRPSAQQYQQAPPPQRAPQGRSQVEQDELYARQLAQHYQNQDYMQSRQQGQQVRGPQGGLSPNQQGYYEEERERSFIDDDLPVIRDNIRKGFLETQSKFNSFISNIKKKMDEEYDDDPPPPPPPRPNQPYGGSDYARRSGDHARYDADPQVLGDDFTALQLKDETTTPKGGSGRTAANPDLFKPTPATPPVQSGRRVSFQEGPPEDINEALHRSSPDPNQRTTSPANKNSKWQPLTAVDPDPVGEHDPFSLGDSDDEDAKKKEVKPEDAERLQRATAEAMADELGSGKNDTEAKGGAAGK